MKTTQSIKIRVSKRDFPTVSDKEQITIKIKTQMEKYNYGFSRWLESPKCVLRNTDYQMIITCMKTKAKPKVFPEYKRLYNKLGNRGYWIRLNTICKLLEDNYPAYKKWVYDENPEMSKSLLKPIPLIGDFDIKYFML